MYPAVAGSSHLSCSTQPASHILPCMRATPFGSGVQAVRLQPSLAEARFALARLLLRVQGRAAGAVAAYEQLLAAESQLDGTLRGHALIEYSEALSGASVWPDPNPDPNPNPNLRPNPNPNPNPNLSPKPEPSPNPNPNPNLSPNPNPNPEPHPNPKPDPNPNPSRQ
jgi:outer membrane biosynthesis protein TonB